MPSWMASAKWEDVPTGTLWSGLPTGPGLTATVRWASTTTASLSSQTPSLAPTDSSPPRSTRSTHRSACPTCASSNRLWTGPTSPRVWVRCSGSQCWQQLTRAAHLIRYPAAWWMYTAAAGLLQWAAVHMHRGQEATVPLIQLWRHPRHLYSHPNPTELDTRLSQITASYTEGLFMTAFSFMLAGFPVVPRSSASSAFGRSDWQPATISQFVIIKIQESSLLSPPNKYWYNNNFPPIWMSELKSHRARKFGHWIILSGWK